MSTKEQVEEGGSLATQEKICREYASKNGYDVTKVFIEQGESAKNANRTQLTEMLAYCNVRKNGISVVIAHKIDRIARNIDDYRQIRLSLKMHGVEIKSTSEYFEDTPAGRFMENIIANVAQFDNDVRTERSVGGMRDAIREGRFVWQGPIGYNNVKIAGKANIVPNVMAPLVTKAFEEVAKNLLPVDEIRRQLIKEGLVNRKGRPLSKAYFYLMLSNELYTGHIVGLGERVRGIFEPIVTLELFEQVQRVLKRRTHRVLQYKRDNPDFPLRRFISHPSGKKLTGCWAKGRNKKYAYYLFHMKGFQFRKDHLETAFKEFFDQFTLKEEQYATLISRVKYHLIHATENKRKEIAQSKRHIVNLKERQKALIKKNLDGVISDTILRDQLEDIETELMHASTLTVSTYDFGKRDLEEAFAQVEEYIKRPSALWEAAPLHCKLKLQWFNFPKGIIFDGEKFQTTEVCNLFKAIRSFTPSLSNRVHPTNPALNHLTAPTDEEISKLAKEILDLAQIISGVSLK